MNALHPWQPDLGRIAADLERASIDNLEVFEQTGSAGIASETCEECGRPLVIDEYGTWFGSPSRSDVRLAHYTCTHGRDPE